MREIKFRAWDRTMKRFILEPQHFALTFDHKIINFDSSGYDYMDNFELQQFTGLKDKNGVEIYEGDVVRCTTRKKDDKRRLDEQFVSDVYWDVDTFLVHDSPTCDTPIGCYDGNNKSLIYPVNPTIEVIGNIYENPDLLEQQ